MPQPLLQSSQSSQSSQMREQSSMLLERRDVYGQGIVETIAHIDQGVVLIEQRTTTTSLFIPLLSPQAKERLKHVLALSAQVA